MKIKTEQHPYNVYEAWTAIDEDTYDGAPDSNYPVGWGNTEREAINDLVEQIVEDLERQVERAKDDAREYVVKALNRRVTEQIEGKPTGNSLTAASPCPPDSEVIPRPSSPDSEVTTGILEQSEEAEGGCMGRMEDEQDLERDGRVYYDE